MSDLEVLWRPLRIGATTVRNRIFVSAHQTGYAGEAGGVVGERYARYLGERARGGAGLVITEVSCVNRMGPRRLGAWRPEITRTWRSLADAVQSHGGRVFVQLWHPGTHEVGTADLDDWHPALGPSALPSLYHGAIAKPMEPGDIAAVVRAYGDAAERVREGGIDGIEVQAGHGYLLSEFLSPLTNRREDEYGGGVENRCRLVLEVANEIRRRCGRDFTVGARLSFDEFVPGDAGLTPERSSEVLAVLASAGCFDFFNVSGGSFHSQYRMIPSVQEDREGHLAPHAAAAKEVVGDGCPVFVASGIRKVETAAAIVSRGQADMVAMTRAHLADPQLVEKAQAGHLGRIRLCVGANQGCQRRLQLHGNVACTVNPAAGREWRWAPRNLVPAPPGTRVLIVGGGPAGMKAAETAARRGCEVILVEREAELGGQLRFAGRLPHRGTWAELAAEMARELDHLGVEVRRGVEADRRLVAAIGADTVILAVGADFDRSGYSHSHPLPGGVPGHGLPHVLDPIAAIASPERLGERVVVFDDTGTQLAIGLAQLALENGRDVELVSRHLYAGAAGLWQTGDLQVAYPQLLAAGGRLRPQTTLREIGPGEVVVRSVWGGPEERLPADSVVLSGLRHSRDGLYRELAAAGLAAARIGDCLAPREVDDAMFEAVQAGCAVGAELGELAPPAA